MLLHGSAFPQVSGRRLLALYPPQLPHPGLLLPSSDHVIEVAASNFLHQAKRNIQYILLEVTQLWIKEWDSSNGSQSRAHSTSLAGAMHCPHTYLSICKPSNHHDPQETGTHHHQNANPRIIQDPAITPLWEQSLGTLPNTAWKVSMDHMQKEGFPQNHAH